MDFVVARALEFFVDHVVHAGARVDEGGADDRERAAFLKVSGGAEDALRALQGVGVHAAREHLARGRDYGVVGAGETRDGVEEDDDVALAFGKALGLLDDHFGHLDVTGGGFVEGGGDDLGLDGALHFGHFLGTFVDEEDEESDVGVVGDDRVGDVLHQDRLAGLRRSDDQGALALADRGDHVDDAAREVLVAAHVALEHEMLVREERRQVLEQHAVLDALGRQAVDGVDAHECEVAFAVLGRADLAFDRVAGVKIEAADLGGRDVDVVRARKIGAVGAAKEAEAVGKHFERAVTEDLLAALGLLLENGEHELLLAHALGVVDFERVGDVEQLRDVKGLEVGKMHSGF